MKQPSISAYLAQAAPGVLKFGEARMALVDVESGFWSLRRQLESLLGEKIASEIFQQAGANGGASYAATQRQAADPQVQEKSFLDCLQAYQAAGFGKFDILQATWPLGRVTVQVRDSFEAWMMTRHGKCSGNPVCAYTAGVLVGFINIVSQRRDVVCIERSCQACGDEVCELELLPAAQVEGQAVIAFTPDPALGSLTALPAVLDETHLRETLTRLTENESILRSIFENAQHFGIYRVTLDPSSPYGGRVTLASPSIRELTGAQDYYNFPSWFEHLHPEDAPRVLEANRRALETGEPYNQVTRVYNPRQGRWCWVQTISYPGYDSSGRMTHFDGMVIDLTDQKEAELALQEINATLEERVRARTEELERRRSTAESLRDIIRMINSNIPLEEFLQRAVKLAAQQLGAGACVLHQLDVENQVITQAASYGMESVFTRHTSRPFSALKPSGGQGYVEALLSRQPIFGNYPPLPERLDEIRQDPTIPEAIKRERIALRERYAGSFAVPLYIQDKLYGGMVFYYTEPQDFHEEQIQLGLAFAEQVAVALENARLLQETEQRRAVAESLRDIITKINTVDDLNLVLDFIVTQASGLSASKFVALYVQADDHIEIRAMQGEFPEAMKQIKLHSGEGTVGRAIAEQRLMLIQDVDKINIAPTSDQIAPESPVFVGNENLELLRQTADAFKAVMAIPLMAQGNVYGALAFYYPQPRQFQPEEIELATTFANQASLAIENALLRGQAAQGAALEERSRLARDLHDAVSQTLFSASLIAEVLPKLWERNPELGAQKLDEMRQLTRGALSEMRTLLLELRPAALVEMDLADLLQHLVNAFSARARLLVDFTVEGQVDPPEQVKVVLYRVAQEALNNIAKHAAASHITITLRRAETSARLQVRDDGRGFDPSKMPVTSLGLGIMRERASSIGAQLSVESRLGEGTLVYLSWN